MFTQAALSACPFCFGMVLLLNAVPLNHKLKLSNPSNIETEYSALKEQR